MLLQENMHTTLEKLPIDLKSKSSPLFPLRDEKHLILTIALKLKFNLRLNLIEI